MTAAEVESRVHSEIADQWGRWTPHGLDLRRCVVRPPRLETYISHAGGREVPLGLWLVVEEDPDTHSGYEVFYDAQEDVFGLGTVGKDGRRYYLGGYGSLWRTLECM